MLPEIYFQIQWNTSIFLYLHMSLYIRDIFPRIFNKYFTVLHPMFETIFTVGTFSSLIMHLRFARVTSNAMHHLGPTESPTLSISPLFLIIRKPNAVQDCFAFSRNLVLSYQFSILTVLIMNYIKLLFKPEIGWFRSPMVPLACTL